MRASSGAHPAIGSSRSKRPSSSSVNAHTVVTGFVIEAMRKIVSRSTGAPDTRSRRPTVTICRTAPFRQTSVAAPASAPASTSVRSASSIGLFPVISLASVQRRFLLRLLNKCTIFYRMASKNKGSPRGKPKGDKRERTRSALLEAARALVRENGYEGTTLEKVATRAGMTTGAIYGNFRNRDELFIALGQAYWPPI